MRQKHLLKVLHFENFYDPRLIAVVPLGCVTALSL